MSIIAIQFDQNVYLFIYLFILFFIRHGGSAIRELDRSCLTLQQTIGQGQYGFVRRGEYDDKTGAGPVPVAVKVSCDGVCVVVVGVVVVIMVLVLVLVGGGDCWKERRKSL